jgi:hypothetical protein
MSSVKQLRKAKRQITNAKEQRIMGQDRTCAICIYFDKRITPAFSEEVV